MFSNALSNRTKYENIILYNIYIIIIYNWKIKNHHALKVNIIIKSSNFARFFSKLETYFGFTVSKEKIKSFVVWSTLV